MRTIDSRSITTPVYVGYNVLAINQSCQRNDASYRLFQFIIDFDEISKDKEGLAESPFL